MFFSIVHKMNIPLYPREKYVNATKSSFLKGDSHIPELHLSL